MAAGVLRDNISRCRALPASSSFRLILVTAFVNISFKCMQTTQNMEWLSDTVAKAILSMSSILQIQGAYSA